jgi:hypothetical protein
MTNAMTLPLDCDAFEAGLADYLEGDLPGSAVAAMEAHAASCAGCAQLLADLGAIRHDAAALPALVPSRDLWAGIADRIDAPVLPLESSRLMARAARRAWLRPAAAAAALVIATAGITHVLTRASYAPTAQPAPVQQVAVAPPASEPQASAQPDEPSVEAPAEPAAAASPKAGRPSTRGRAPERSAAERRRSEPSAAPRTAGSTVRLASAEPLMKEAEPVYDREIVKLRAIVRERRSQLDPRTVAVLEQSIAVIDSAIAQSRAALAKDPASGFLATQLNHSLEKKVELLRTAALLPART